MKTDDFPSSTFVLRKVNRCTRYIVLDTIIRLSGFPEVITFLKGSLCTGVGKKVLIKGAKVIRKIISWFQHRNHLALEKVEDIIPRDDEHFYVRL